MIEVYSKATMVWQYLKGSNQRCFTVNFDDFKSLKCKHRIVLLWKPKFQNVIPRRLAPHSGLVTCYPAQERPPPAASLVAASSPDWGHPSRQPSRTCPGSPRSSPAGRLALQDFFWVGGVCWFRWGPDHAHRFRRENSRGGHTNKHTHPHTPWQQFGCGIIKAVVVHDWGGCGDFDFFLLFLDVDRSGPEVEVSEVVVMAVIARFFCGIGFVNFWHAWDREEEVLFVL